MHDDIVYNPLQQETMKYVKEDCNLVVLAPTSSGKTIVAEQFMWPTLQDRKRSLYLSPLKALTQEKMEEWENWPFSSVAITSDHYKGRSITEPLVLMTTEALDSKTRGSQQWLRKVGVLVVDEAHLLSSLGRGDATEVGLTRFSTINNQARIILLSATIPNAKELGDWLTTLNGKRTEVVETDWRPIEQEWHFIELNEFEWSFNSEAVDITKSLRDKSKGQMLIFVHTLAKGNMIAKNLGIPFHNSRLSKEKRRNLEDMFREKKVDTMVSTSTLAYGINQPADIGVIVGAHRGPMTVDLQDMKQMAGRIGRYGLSETAIVYFLLRGDYYKDVKSGMNRIPNVNSVLSERLYFHITSFVARENMQIAEIHKFLKNTLAYHQNLVTSPTSHLNILLDAGVIEKISDGNLLPTLIAKASALMYVDPLDLLKLKQNLTKKETSPAFIAIAFADIPSNEVHTYVPNDLSDLVELEFGMQTLIATGLYQWLSGNELHPSLISILFPYLNDVDRWINALSIAGMDKDYLDTVKLMLDYGVPDKLSELIRLPKIGRKRALSLYRHNIETQQQLVENELVGRNILGSKIYETVTNQIKNPGKIFLNF